MTKHTMTSVQARPLYAVPCVIYVHAESPQEANMEATLASQAFQMGGAVHGLEFPLPPEKIEYVSNGKHVNGRAAIGDIVGYQDVANHWTPQRVDDVVLSANRVSIDQYWLVDLDTGHRHASDLRQAGWTFSKIYETIGWVRRSGA